MPKELKKAGIFLISKRKTKCKETICFFYLLRFIEL